MVAGDLRDGSHARLVLAAIVRDAPDANAVLLGPAAGDPAGGIQSRVFTPEAANSDWTCANSGRQQTSILSLSLKYFQAARDCFARLRPALVLVDGESPGAGGAAIAAAWQRIPSALFVPDASPGFLQCRLGRLAGRIFLAYRDAEAAFPPDKTLFTGYPVETTRESRAKVAERLGLQPYKPTLLVISRGEEGRSIVQALLTNLPSLLLLDPGLQVLHLAGADGYKAMGEAMAHLNLAVEMASRVRTIADGYGTASLYNLADLVLADAGAINPAALAAIGLPMVLVAGKDGSGSKNAQAMRRMNAARLLDSQALRGTGFRREIFPLLREALLLERMRLASKAAGGNDAALKMARYLLAAAAPGGWPPQSQRSGLDADKRP